MSCAFFAVFSCLLEKMWDAGQVYYDLLIPPTVTDELSIKLCSEPEDLFVG